MAGGTGGASWSVMHPPAPEQDQPEFRPGPAGPGGKEGAPGMGQEAKDAVTTSGAVQGQGTRLASGAFDAVAGTGSGPGRVAAALGRRGGDGG